MLPGLRTIGSDLAWISKMMPLTVLDEGVRLCCWAGLVRIEVIFFLG